MQVFTLFDPDGDGAISSSEVAQTLKEYANIPVKEADIEALLSEIDNDGNGELSFCEFAALMATSHRAEDYVPTVDPQPMIIEESKAVLNKVLATPSGKLTRAMCDSMRQQLTILLGENMAGPLNSTVGKNVARELCRETEHVTLEPFQRLSREAKDYAEDWWIVVEGSLTLWRQEETNMKAEV